MLNKSSSTSMIKTGNNIVFNAGGGSGRSNLNFSSLKEGQNEMFSRTINQLSDHSIWNQNQELRQLKIVEKPVTIYITVAREDFPDVTSQFEITYIPSAAQSAWTILLEDIVKKLKVDFIYCIVDRNDRSPVNRILRLRNNGEYYVRQREASAILEVINTGRTPLEISWEIAMDINNLKADLAFSNKTMPVVEKRIADLVNRNATRDVQIKIMKDIMKATTPMKLIYLISNFHKNYDLHKTEEEKQYDKQLKLDKELKAKQDAELEAKGLYVKKKKVLEEPILFSDIIKYDKVVDIISIHRLVLESLRRFVIEGNARLVAEEKCYEYISKVISELRSEVDIVNMGLKLLSDIMKYLIDFRENLIHIILDCIQAYAPPAVGHRKRDPQRLRQTLDLYADLATNSIPIEINLTGNNKHSNNLSNAKDKYIINHSNNENIDEFGQRYGNFYGQSDKINQKEIEKDVHLLKIKKEDLNHEISIHVNTLPYLKDNNKDNNIDNNIINNIIVPTIEIKSNNEDVVTDNIDNELEVKAIIRERNRVDHKVVIQALEDAGLQTTTITTNDLNDNLNNNTSIRNELNKKELVINQQQHHTTNTLISIPKTLPSKKSKRTSSYAFKLKPISDSSMNEITNDQINNKYSTWKGSMGEIGRKAPEKVVEQKIDFKLKKLAKAFQLEDKAIVDHIEEGDKEDVNNDLIVTNQAIKDETNIITQLENIENNNTTLIENDNMNEAIKSNSLIDNIILNPIEDVDNNNENIIIKETIIPLKPKKEQRKRGKNALKPLPIVDCVIFRGISGKMKQNMSLTQSFATLYKMMSQNYGNREIGFKLGIIEEISVIVTVCQEMPRVLDYYIWIIDVLYRDGFGEYLTPEDLEEFAEDFTMILSVDSKLTEGNSVVPISYPLLPKGYVIETISEMSLPSIDQDEIRSEKTPKPNIGKELSEKEYKAKSRDDMIKNKSILHNNAMNGNDDNDSKKTSDAIDGIQPTTGAAATTTNDGMKKNKGPNKILQNVLGLFDFEERYVKRPHDNVILAVAMISAHHELDQKEKEIAAIWLDTWDDCSRDFKLLRKKGCGLAGL